MNEDRSLYTFILSLAIHGSLAVFILYGQNPFENPKTETIEIDLREKERYIIEAQQPQTTRKSLKEKLKEEAKLLSNITQRVKEQIRARKGVKTRNTGSPQKKEPRFTYDPSSLNQIKPAPALRKMAIGNAEFAEKVPGIREGSFNSLNTDQITYFTFYSRVNQQIGYRWVSLVKNYLYGLPLDQLRRISESNKRTVVEVLLDQQGNYFSSLIHNSSGIQALDEATYKAFRLATPFLNPPQGLVNKEDGLIHLYYEFNVVFDPLPMAGPNQF